MVLAARSSCLRLARPSRWSLSRGGQGGSQNSPVPAVSIGCRTQLTLCTLRLSIATSPHFSAGDRSAPQRLAIDRHHLARPQNRRYTRHNALFRLLKIQRREDPIEHVTGWNAAGKIQKALEPRVFEMSITLNLVSANGRSKSPR